MTIAPASLDIRRPASPRELFLTYTFISLQSFGGAIGFVERTLVREKRWLTVEEFVGLYAISRAMPGPSGIALCVLVGDRFFGLRGVIAAVLGSLLAPSVIVVILATAVRHVAQQPAVQGMLYGMGAASIGVILNTGTRMASTLRGNGVGVAVTLLSFAGIALLHLPLVRVMVTLGVASVLWAWWWRRSK